MAQRRTGARKETIWFPSVGTTGTALDALAQDAQATFFDLAIEHPGTNQDYQGAIFGVRIWILPRETMTNVLSLELVLLKLPQGLSVPSVITAATKKQNEQYVWALQAVMVSQAPGGTTLNGGNPLVFELGSARRFNAGDRLVLVAINRGPAGSTTQELAYVVDAYVMPG